jgi:PAS domain S-box-containing protein
MDEKPGFEALENRIKDLEKDLQKQKKVIQEIKSAGNKQAEMVSFFKNLLDLAPNFLSYVDKNHIYQYVNRHYQDFFQMDSDAIIGLSTKEVLGEDGHKATRGKIKAVLMGQAQEFETPLKRPDGQLVYLKAQYIPHYIDNLVEGFLVVVEDITERKKAEIKLRESEARFRSLVENSLVGISVFWKGRHIYQNPEYRRIFGPIPEDEPFPYLENIHTEDVQHIEQLYGGFVRGNNRIFEAEYRVYPFSTEQFSRSINWVQCRAIHVKYEGSQAIIATVMDTTRVKELEVLVSVEDKMSSLGRVATGIAHELRNPVSAINVYLAVIQEALQELTAQEQNKIETLNKACRQMQEATNRIDSTVRKVMDFAKPSTPQLVNADLNQSIQKVIDLCDAALRKTNISLKTVLDSNLPKSLVDSHLIERVLLNLLSNAIQVLKDHDGARKIEISSQKTNSSIIICVADSGPGVSEDIQDKIFDPFYTTAAGGSGIGLSISRRIVSDHYGRIDVGKSKWGGAEFKIQLPSPEHADNNKQRMLNRQEA